MSDITTEYDDMVSYEEAALMIGCDHHYVRMLTSRGRFNIVERIEVRPNVLKVFISRYDVDQYIEEKRVRHTGTVRLTEAQWQQFRREFGAKAIRRGGA